MAITRLSDDADANLLNDVVSQDDHKTQQDVFLKELVDKVDEAIDQLNTHISDMAVNNAKVGITTAQANAITANTAKVTFPGLGTTSTTALAGNTKIPTITVEAAPGLTVGFENLQVQKTGTTVDLKVTDHTGKSPVTYTSVITLK